MIKGIVIIITIMIRYNNKINNKNGNKYNYYEMIRLIILVTTPKVLIEIITTMVIAITQISLEKMPEKWS